MDERLYGYAKTALILFSMFAIGYMLLLTSKLVWFMMPIFAPFLLAGLLAYLGDPIVDRLEVKLSRTMAVVVVFSVIFTTLTLVAVILVPLLETQISRFITRIPAYLQWIESVLVPIFQDYLGITDPVSKAMHQIRESAMTHLKQTGSIVTSVLLYVTQSSLLFFAWTVNLVLIPVLTFYMLRDWDHIVARVHELLPRRYEPTIVRLARESDSVLGAFLRGQFLVMLGLGVIYSSGLWVVGLELGLLIGMMAGLVSFVPYLGFIVGVLVAGLAALVQFGDLWHFIAVLAVFGVGQMIEGFWLTPTLVGDRIGLHPVAVIFAVLAGGQLFGFFGILLALPVAAVVMVLLRFVHEKYKSSESYSSV